MPVKLETQSFHYEGAHFTPGRGGTRLGFDIRLEPTVAMGLGDPVVERRDELYWRAVVDVHNGPESRTTPKDSKGYQAEAWGKNPIATMEKLADNLRRVADALDEALEEGITVPIILHRKKPKQETDEGEGEVESIDSILSGGDE